MKIKVQDKYYKVMPPKLVELSNFVRDALSTNSYYDQGQLEQMEGSIKNISEFLGALTDILVEKKIVNLSDLERLLPANGQEIFLDESL